MTVNKEQGKRYLKDLKKFLTQMQQSEHKYFKQSQIWARGMPNLPEFSQSNNLLNYDSAITGDQSNGLGDGIYLTQDSLAFREMLKMEWPDDQQIFIDVASPVRTALMFSQFAKCYYVDPRGLHEWYASIMAASLGMAWVKEEGQRLTDSFPEKCVPLVTSLHAPEHFGLGRYGDEVDFDGTFKFFQEVHKVLADDGVFMFSVPVSAEPRIEFHNARVYGPEILEQLMKDTGFTPLNIYIILGAPNELSDPESDPELDYNFGQTNLDMKWNTHIDILSYRAHKSGESAEEAPPIEPSFDKGPVSYNNLPSIIRTYYQVPVNTCIDTGIWAKWSSELLRLVENGCTSPLEHRCMLITAKKIEKEN